MTKTVVTIKKPDLLSGPYRLSSQCHEAPFIPSSLFAMFTPYKDLKKRGEKPQARKYTVITGRRFDGVKFRAAVYTSLPAYRFQNLPDAPYYINIFQQTNGNWVVDFRCEHIIASKYAKLTPEEFSKYFTNLELRGAISFISDPSDK